ncbi:MAG: GyrI-like domain-containing protein [Bacteroidota bacterium]|nr:GyrI-like domain-containing protein [Bacteroidota bacterium]
MNIEVIDKNLVMTLYGFSGKAVSRNYAETGFKLMNRMWEIVKSAGLKNKGINIWVYEPGDNMFAGVELENAPPNDTGLESKMVNLAKYVYYKHVGPYNQLPEAYRKMKEESANRDLKISLPYLEVYGHWTADETKLETGIIFSLE